MASDTTTLYCDFRHVVLGSSVIDFPAAGDFCQFKLPHDTRGGIALNSLQILAYKHAFVPYHPSFSGKKSTAGSDQEENASKSKQAVEEAKEAAKKELQHKK